VYHQANAAKNVSALFAFIASQATTFFFIAKFLKTKKRYLKER